MSILKLPEEKNITEFSEKELELWLKDYIDGWAKKGVSVSVHYEAVKVELVRRNNKNLHKLTVVLVVLTVILVFLTLALIFIELSGSK